MNKNRIEHRQGASNITATLLFKGSLSNDDGDGNENGKKPMGQIFKRSLT